jgi:hypothetical protein
MKYPWRLPNSRNYVLGKLREPAPAVNSLDIRSHRTDMASSEVSGLDRQQVTQELPWSDGSDCN